jgi:predicted DNA-binding transcriptional regulator AlpA
MTEIVVFYELKKSVLEHYKKRYPYFNGDWKSFSSQDILNLIEAVFEETKSSVSEKWIYTHLKPEANEKLPRKDMLDIFSKYVGKASWDEFKFSFKEVEKVEINKKVIVSEKVFNTKKRVIFGFILLVFSSVIFWKQYKKEAKTKVINLKEQFSNDTISSENTKAYVVEDAIEKEIPIANSKIEVDENATVIVKSPFFKEKNINLKQQPEVNIIELVPNDYVAILNGFIKSDIKDWQTRKTQLELILEDNAEVIIMLKNNLGSEYFNKSEFSQKLIIPTASLKKLKIVEVKNNQKNKITFVRLIEE